MFDKIKIQKNNKKYGFTLVELLVTITIFVILTGVVLVNSNSFNNTVLLHDFAYDVALTIKQAQSYGVNVNESSVATQNVFSYPYGVYFNLDQSNTNFVLFNDTNSDHIYNTGVTSCPSTDPECVQKYSMMRGTHISGLCAGSDLGSNCTTVHQLSILFQRPSLKAQIYSWSGGTISGPLNDAKITLSAADGSTASVVITSIGQIYTN